MSELDLDFSVALQIRFLECCKLEDEQCSKIQKPSESQPLREAM